jgi:hypothetical protein
MIVNHRISVHVRGWCGFIHKKRGPLDEMW